MSLKSSARLLLFTFAILALVVLANQRAMAQSVNPQPVQDTDEQRIQELAIAYHILFTQNVIDGWGHVSVRSVSNPRHFFIARNLAPALVTRNDIFECDENSQPVKPGVQMVGERFIHGEIYRARPDVQAVVHSHAPAVVPFGVTGVPLRPVMHMAGFLPQQVPVFEIRDTAGEDNEVLVRSTRVGAGLAKALGDSPVVLMRGHGMSVVAPTLKMAVFRAIYTQLDAAIELQALSLGTPKFLNEREAARVNAINESSMRAWDYWVAQSEVVSASLIRAMPKQIAAPAN